MNQLAALTLLLFTSLSSFAQKEYAPEFLIPYNNNGVWGWCDTLGEVIIEPQFQEVGFFVYKGRGVKTLIEADVKTKSGYNRYSYPGGLVVPETYKIYNELYNYTEEDTKRWITIQAENKKLGIYEASNKTLAVKPEWDIVEYDSDFREVVYLKKETEKVYYRFDRANGKLSKTDIDSLFYTEDVQRESLYFGSSFWFFKHTNGTITTLVNGKEVLLTSAQKKILLSENDFFGYGNATEGPGSDYFDNHGKIFDSHSKMKDTATCMIGLIQFPGKTRDELKEFRVIRENGKIGVYDNHGILILPFVYEKLELQNNNKQVLLYSGNKVGMKLFFTDYKTVEPKYDSINFYHSIRVNSHWMFMIYEVTLGDQKGLIGENGIEYFHFD